MSIKLSVCIPTWNRAAFLGQTLKSVVHQATDEVEIVVSDNASEDDTPRIIEEYASAFPRLRYFRWDKNMGFDRNILKTVELAQGDWCWFLGDDDIIEDDGVKVVLEALSQYPDTAGLSVNRNIYTFDLSSRLPIPPPVSGNFSKCEVFKDTNKICLALPFFLGQDFSFSRDSYADLSGDAMGLSAYMEETGLDGVLTLRTNSMCERHTSRI